MDRSIWTEFRLVTLMDGSEETAGGPEAVCLAEVTWLGNNKQSVIDDMSTRWTSYCDETVV